MDLMCFYLILLRSNDAMNQWSYLSFYYLLKKPAYRTTLLVGHSQSVLDSLIVGLSELP
uniref:Uncharacterized protein n=1 Tax=Picea sitchensis TaxID=3332 RepID=A0A6B9XQE6_PICSI|nr:hypothetical protein Q903MT_gene3791 [Picea sitchensis]